MGEGANRGKDLSLSMFFRFPHAPIHRFMTYIMDEKDRKLIRMVGVLSTLGLTLVFSTVIGLYIGIKLDEWLGTAPWFTVIFLLLGIIAGFRNLFVHVKNSQQTLDEDDKKDHE